MADTPANRLQLNEDGTVGIPVKGENPRTIILQEPSMDEIGWIHDIVHAADEALLKVPDLGVRPPPSAPIAEQQAYLDAANDVAKKGTERSMQMFGPESPHGAALIQIIEKLAGESVTTGELYGWGRNSATCRLIIGHFTAPLGGAAADPATALAQLLASAQQ